MIKKITEKIVKTLPFKMILGVPWNKELAKLTSKRAHYYTGKLSKGKKVICTGNYYPNNMITSLLLKQLKKIYA